MNEKAAKEGGQEGRCVYRNKINIAQEFDLAHVPAPDDLIRKLPLCLVSISDAMVYEHFF